jgi:DNA-binding response OmpR family regulator
MERKIILFVDDDPDTLEAYRDFLQGEFTEFDLLVATNGEEGRKIFDQHQGRFLIIFTDRTMPVTNGDMLALWIRKSDPMVPVFMITGDDTIPTEIQSLLTGCLRKPAEPAVILKTIRNAILSRR